MTGTRKRLTLTFDNGPDVRTTPHVLDTLAKRNLKATFFVVGKNLAVPALRKLAEQAHAEGHWIGNHTYSHEIPLGDRHDPGAARSEIGATQDLIGDLAHPDKFFRPFGDGGQLNSRLLNAEAREFLESRGYTCVLWNSIPRDWEDVDGWVDRALTQLDNLGKYLDAIAERGVEIVQEFPDECLIIRNGQSNDLQLAKIGFVGSQS